MYRVVAITSSNKQNNTAEVVAEVKEILNQEDIEVKVVNLYGYNLEQCTNCEAYVGKTKCMSKLEMPCLMQQLEASDGMLISSPVSIQNSRDKLNVFIDRTCSWFHKQELYGRPLVVISKTKRSGVKSTLKYLQKIDCSGGW